MSVLFKRKSSTHQDYPNAPICGLLNSDALVSCVGFKSRVGFSGSYVDGCSKVGVVASPRCQGQEEMASSCARILAWILGNISSERVVRH